MFKLCTILLFINKLTSQFQNTCEHSGDIHLWCLLFVITFLVCKSLVSNNRCKGYYHDIEKKKWIPRTSTTAEQNLKVIGMGLYALIIKWAASWQPLPAPPPPNKKRLCAQRRLRSAWAFAQSDQSSLSAWRKLEFWATHSAHSKEWWDWGMPRLIWIFAGLTVILLVLSRGGS